MAKILAVRFSALGDVAMAMSVLKSFADKYANDEITFLCRPVATMLMEGLPQNVKARPVDLGNYRGVWGLKKLADELLAEGYDALADWHDVLRTKILRTSFRLHGKRVAVIDKGRRQRYQLVREKNKVRTQLEGSPQRYADVLERLGYPVELRPWRMYPRRGADITDLLSLTGEKQGAFWTGIAPFAAHKGKIYPPQLMKEAINLLNGDPNTRIFIFGGGEKEREWAEDVAATYKNASSLIGKIRLRHELRLMNRMDVMVTMDSANMHLAAISGVPTLSLWGATHPLAGFVGMPVEGSRILQTEMDCRPCSIFGNKPCRWGDLRCLTSISPQQLADAIRSFRPKESISSPNEVASCSCEVASSQHETTVNLQKSEISSREPIKG